ncbi:hypothetical protein [Candidatus Synchoanobacter obligatus]|uniref:Uncharacterized protein n=1 Tax=Candidatus Synchoanobacter obligatus TaxID=2919597 RepID=A0ABT1L4B2_9GAMM|nr:hypothetical protein [Candidatus Synchoanobacter obligatus]MCP8351708.1 hypothetical protein [Candidatus Synchoanobacter obligatus]
MDAPPPPEDKHDFVIVNDTTVEAGSNVNPKFFQRVTQAASNLLSYFSRNRGTYLSPTTYEDLGNESYTRSDEPDSNSKQEPPQPNVTRTAITTEQGGHLVKKP